MSDWNCACHHAPEQHWAADGCEIIGCGCKLKWVPPPGALDHRRGLGGTEISMVVGCSPYGDALTVFDRIVRGVELVQNASMARGKKYEPEVRRRYVEATGAVLAPKPKILEHPQHHWAIGSIDELASVMGEDVVAEFKTATKWGLKKWGPEFTDKVPPNYLCQCHWYLGITGRKRCHLYAAFGADQGEDFIIEQCRLYIIDRDEEVERGLLAAGESFWRNHIETGIAPQRRAA